MSCGRDCRCKNNGSTSRKFFQDTKYGKAKNKSEADALRIIGIIAISMIGLTILTYIKGV